MIVAKWCWILLMMPGLCGAAPAPDIEAFVREGCPHCTKAKAFLASLKQEQPELNVLIRDVIREPAALERLKNLSENRGAARVPAFFVGGQLIIGFSDEASTGKLIRDSLNLERSQHHETTEIFSIEWFGGKVTPDQLGLPLFTVAMGLLDGLNPCSMWVLILMISLLAPMQNRPRMLAVAGAFVAVEGAAYFVFMAAWLNLFLLVGASRISEILIALFALLAGAINLKDFWAYGWGVSLSIPAAAKPGIYTRMRRILLAETLAPAILGAVVLAVLVQIVEFMCSSGFPALFTRILTLKQLDSASYYGYLLLYDLAYMLDDVIVLAIGVVTLSQKRLQEKEGRWLKLISGLVMVGLGVYLINGVRVD